VKLNEKDKNIPSLDDLAFEGRNKTYGSYYLRKRYLKFLLVSVVAAILFFLTIFLVPFITYYLEDSDLLLREENLYVIDYSFIPAPEDDMSTILKALPAPPAPEMQTPVVVDTVIEEVKQPDKTPPREEVDNKSKIDSTGKSNGKSDQGEGIGNDSGIYTVIDVVPQFPGGDEARLAFLRNSIHYPEAALKNHIQGIVVLVIVIEKDGSVSHIEVNKSIGGDAMMRQSGSLKPCRDGNPVNAADVLSGSCLKCLFYSDYPDHTGSQNKKRALKPSFTLTNML